MKIGIYSIFIGKYTVYYKDFVENISKNFLPNHKKIFYIVTDTDLPKYNNDTIFFKTERIGWPYETLYRYKYFLKFQDVQADVIYFLNANAYLPKPIADILPDQTKHVFVIHDGFYRSPYKNITFDKNPISTAFIKHEPRKVYHYYGGRFNGAMKEEFIKMCEILDTNITLDEKKGYIAVWHDESHINHYINNILNHSVKALDTTYHVPECRLSDFKNKVKMMYFTKETKMDINEIKGKCTNGKVIKNKYNEYIFNYIGNYNNNFTFNVLIATVGRPTLQNMLDSLSPQLLESDCLTIVFDGNSRIPSGFDYSKFKCKLNLFNEPSALKYWGHGIRNKYANLLEKKDFIMHADDDDIYTPQAFHIIRSTIMNNSTLYFFKMLFDNSAWPLHHNCKEGNIGTPCGIIPYDLNKKGIWLNRYGGDGAFYEQILQQVNDVVYSDDFIYIVRA